MMYSGISFYKYLLTKKSKIYFLSALSIGIIYFIVLRLVYPIPSYYSDSFTWVGAAQSGQPVTFRPVGYSKLMIFFKSFSTSDVALIAAQFFTNLVVNLFLFFTCLYFFEFKRGFRILLFCLLIINPFYAFYSNYISSDPFFCCFSVLWFTLLIWILHKPTWLLLVAQLIVLAALFELRYNAIFFPVISALAVVLSKQSVAKKVISIAVSVIIIVAIVAATTYVTKKFTGTKTFSAFSGWQLANDALHVMQHKRIDTSKIKDKEIKQLTNFTQNFLEVNKKAFPDSGATAVFMWHINSPLKKYMKVYDPKSKSYFKIWNELGPVYSKFGRTIILQNPVSYVRHFVLPNVRAYFFPPLEIYETYMEDRDTIAAVAQKFYQYKSNKTPPHRPALYAAIFNPTLYLFIAVNIFFIVFGIEYFFSKRYKSKPLLYNQTLLCFTAFYLANFFFIVLLAPSVFRYHIFILTLSFPIILYLVQEKISAFQCHEKSAELVRANKTSY